MGLSVKQLKKVRRNVDKRRIEMSKIKVTVITICLNEEKNVEKTIESVLLQDFLDYEYIIKDGNSSDNTNNIIEKYKDKFDKKGIPFFHFIKQDEGIYDAMNQALTKAKGEWIIFMNAGDEFFNANVLKDIFKYDKYSSVDILYGHTMYCMSGGYKIIVCSNHERLLNKEGICQQSCFVKRKLFDEKKFDSSLKILADFDFLLSSFLEKKHFLNINLIVSKYNHEGVSARNLRQGELEFAKVFAKYNIMLSRRKSKLHIFFSEIFTNCFPVLSDLLMCYKLCKSRK